LGVAQKFGASIALVNRVEQQKITSNQIKLRRNHNGYGKEVSREQGSIHPKEQDNQVEV
jgi:hypothetical protein